MLLQLSWFKGGLSKHNLIQNNKGLCSMYTNPWAAPKDDGIGFTSLLIFNVFFFSNIGAVIDVPILINRQLIREKKTR